MCLASPKTCFSVRSFCQHGYILVFDDKQCLILKDRDKIVGIGVLDDSGLYWFIFEDYAFPLCTIESQKQQHCGIVG